MSIPSPAFGAHGMNIEVMSMQEQRVMADLIKGCMLNGTVRRL